MKKEITRDPKQVGDLRIGWFGVWSRDDGKPVSVKQRLLSGYDLDLLCPSTVDFTIEDLARGLSREARWNGQTIGEFAFSVAQHSIFVMEIICDLERNIGKKRKLMALLHDGEEGLGVKDIITPMKAIIGDVYGEIAGILRELVYAKFDIAGPIKNDTKRLIKKADRIAAAAEAKYLVGFSDEEIRKRLNNFEKILEFEDWSDFLTPWPPIVAERRFIEEINKLRR